MATPQKQPDKTTLDKDTTKPSTTAPGDGPADTTDPNERASTVTPNPGPEALEVGTVNAVKPFPPVEPAPAAAPEGEDRFEEYDVTGPNGKPVRVRRNIETGKSEIVK